MVFLGDLSFHMPSCDFVLAGINVVNGWCNPATKLITKSVFRDAWASQCLFIIPGTNLSLVNVLHLKKENGGNMNIGTIIFNNNVLMNSVLLAGPISCPTNLITTLTDALPTRLR